MIELEHVTVQYRSHRALNDISLRVRRGEFVLVSGPSGCGKTTLALCLAGLIPNTVPAELSGRVLVNGRNAASSPGYLLAREIGMVFQNPATQLFNNKVEEEVAFAPRNLHLPGEEVVARVREAMAVTGIEHLCGRAVRSLSGGEQQRVAIASVLALRPSVLILDEPTANLDWEGVEQLFATLISLNRVRGLTIILVEHRLGMLTKIATRAVLLDRGRIVGDGSPDEVLGDKGRLADLGLRYPWLDTCRRVEPGDPLPIPNGVSPLVALNGVSVFFGRHQALSDVNLDIYPGQFVALVGDNGAGKSTVARLLAGIVRPRCGTVSWHPALRDLPEGRRIGLLFQNPLQQLICDSVEDEVAFGPLNYRIDSDLTPLLSAADLLDLRDRRPQALSAGQQQRTALAATLALGPRLLILDEPTMGQDWAHISRLLDYLLALHSAGQAILLITHDDRLICRYAQRLVRLEKGQIVADGAIRINQTPISDPAYHDNQDNEDTGEGEEKLLAQY